ncbi:hypothetical protein CCACVL1_19295 [Corchorus capsularis]|uniref:Transmembrane protein n=1 Tax=Corchorus capsularis TaxID=210143 RepID=A0A1R3HH95_COCAP|nr:hypothetical protein CCACVL1_19295 [Corchorus capsularis]
MALATAPLTLQFQFHRNHSLTLCCRNTTSVQQLIKVKTSSKCKCNCKCPRNRINLIVVSCQNNNEPSDKSTSKPQKEKEKTQLFAQVLDGAEKLGRGLKENMRPKQKEKGDWKDLMLMSLSFAVYVYMSQQIVCAYFAWMSMSMPTHSW